MKNLKSRSLGLFLVVAIAGQPLYGIQEASDISQESGQTIAQVEEDQKEQGRTERWHSQAKRMVTKPVNYIFGEESSYAKTAFYAAIGVAILAGAYYAYYKKYIFVDPRLKELWTQEQADAEKLAEDIRLDLKDLEAQNRLKELEAQIEIAMEADLKSYRLMVSERIQVQGNLNAARQRANEIIYQYEHFDEMDKLTSKIHDLAQRRLDLEKQEHQFRRDRKYIPLERFRVIEQQAQGIFDRWGRSIIS